MPPMSAAATTALAALVFFAGFVDSLAGGGGLITLPAYLAAGVPPALLLGTNKMSSSIGTSASCLRYSGSLRIRLGPLLPLVGATLAGALLGARLTLWIDPAWIRPFVLVALPLAAAGVLRHHAAPPAASAEPPRPGRGMAVGFAIGAYDGCFGPGTGAFLAVALSRVCGYDLLGASARAKILNLTSNLAALATFLIAGRVDWRLGSLMGLASVAGNMAGASLGLRRGARAIRPAIILVCAALFIKIALDALHFPPP